jgi:hypothetical protein
MSETIAVTLPSETETAQAPDVSTSSFPPRTLRQVQSMFNDALGRHNLGGGPPAYPFSNPLEENPSGGGGGGGPPGPPDPNAGQPAGQNIPPPAANRDVKVFFFFFFFE